MEKIFEFLFKRGYTNISQTYYNHISKWKNIWKGQAEWLNLKTIDNRDYHMYSLDMAQKGCEDLASIITSENFILKASANDNILQQNLKKAKVLKKLPEDIEMMAYSGTAASVTRIKNATVIKEKGIFRLQKNDKTKIATLNLDASQIIPLTVEDGEIINCAFISEEKQKIDNKIVKVWYIELHELQEKGYQVTNAYIRDDTGEMIKKAGVLETYNTLSDIPLFSILKLPKKNSIENNNGLGMALYSNAIDQLMVIDLAYNNFGMDFKLGGKLIIYDKKLVRTINEEYTDENGNINIRQKTIYPTNIQKQQFMIVGDNDITSASDGKPFVHEYNPDLRVGDNKEGVQFGLDCFSFKIGFGTHYYSFENGTVNTATEAILSNKDLVNNCRKVRKEVNEYLVSICNSFFLAEKILGNTQIKEIPNIEVSDVDGFLEDDESKQQKAQNEVSLGLMSKKKYLMEFKHYSEKEAKEELKRIADEEDYEIDVDNDDDITPKEEE